MLNIGLTELLVFGVIALLILGPNKLPEAVRFVSKWSTKMKRFTANVQNDLDRELRLSELREQMQIELKRIQELESKMNIQIANINEIPKPIMQSSEQRLFNHEQTYHFIHGQVSPVHLPINQHLQATEQDKNNPPIRVAV